MGQASTECSIEPPSSSAVSTKNGLDTQPCAALRARLWHLTLQRHVSEKTCTGAAAPQVRSLLFLNYLVTDMVTIFLLLLGFFFGSSSYNVKGKWKGTGSELNRNKGKHGLWFHRERKKSKEKNQAHESINWVKHILCFRNREYASASSTRRSILQLKWHTGSHTFYQERP